MAARSIGRGFQYGVSTARSAARAIPSCGMPMLFNPSGTPTSRAMS